MAFTKISETLPALKKEKATSTFIRSSTPSYRPEDVAPRPSPPGARAVRIAVYIVIMLPSSVLLGQMIHQWTRTIGQGPDGWDISVGILVGVGIGSQ